MPFEFTIFPILFTYLPTRIIVDFFWVTNYLCSAMCNLPIILKLRDVLTESLNLFLIVWVHTSTIDYLLGEMICQCGAICFIILRVLLRVSLNLIG